MALFSLLYRASSDWESSLRAEPIRPPHDEDLAYGSKYVMPKRPLGFQRKPSMTDSSTRLSALNCCKAPDPAPVRQTATRSPGCICSLTNLPSELRTSAMLLKERPRSSTISTMVRRTSSGRSCASGGGGKVATELGEGFSRAALSSAALDTDRKSTRLNSSHLGISYAVFCLKKQKIL